MQNIEFKAELRDPIAARHTATVLGADCIGTLRQHDIYFRVPEGRLKRRQAEGEPIEWIYYHRPDKSRPVMSNFTILTDEQARRRWGTHSLREQLRVTKTRELWMLENVRIHLDNVDELGTFIEFEALVSTEHDVKSCHEQIATLRREFQPILSEPISLSYCDLAAQLQQ